MQQKGNSFYCWLSWFILQLRRWKQYFPPKRWCTCMSSVPPALCWVFAWLILRLWRKRQYICPKHQFTSTGLLMPASRSLLAWLIIRCEDGSCSFRGNLSVFILNSCSRLLATYIHVLLFDPKMEVKCSFETPLYFCRNFAACLISVYLLGFLFHFEDGSGALTKRRWTSEVHDVTSEQTVPRRTNESSVVDRLV